jgi:hypothetical protein
MGIDSQRKSFPPSFPILNFLSQFVLFFFFGKIKIALNFFSNKIALKAENPEKNQKNIYNLKYFLKFPTHSNFFQHGTELLGPRKLVGPLEHERVRQLLEQLADGEALPDEGANRGEHPLPAVGTCRHQQGVNLGGGNVPEIMED